MLVAAEGNCFDIELKPESTYNSKMLKGIVAYAIKNSSDLEGALKKIKKHYGIKTVKHLVLGSSN